MNPFATGFAVLLSLLGLEGALLSLGGWTPVFAWSGSVIVFIAGFATAWLARSGQLLQVFLLGLVAGVALPASQALWRALGAPLDSVGFLAQVALTFPITVLSAVLGGAVAMLAREKLLQ